MAVSNIMAVSNYSHIFIGLFNLGYNFYFFPLEIILVAVFK